MAEYRYVLIGADQLGPFYEHRGDDPKELLEERDRQRPRGENGDTRKFAFFVIDTDAVDGSPECQERGEVDWCAVCEAEAVLASHNDGVCDPCAAGGES